MAFTKKSDPMKAISLVLVVAFSLVVLAVLAVNAKKSTEKRTKAYTCSKVADPKYQIKATSKVLSINQENKEFTWKPNEKSVVRTVLGGCDGVVYVRRGYAGEEADDVPMRFEDLKVGHTVEIIGSSEIAADAARIVPSIVRDVSLSGMAVRGKVGRMLFTTDQGGDVIGFVMSDVIRRSNGAPLGNPMSLYFSNKVGCRRLGETDYTVANCASVRLGHTIEVDGVYDATKQVFIDPFTAIPADGSKFWTKIYDTSLRPDSNAKDWSTDDVSFTADNFYMVIDGKTYSGDALTVSTSDPADPKRPDYTTILRSWTEKNDELKVKFSFRKDDTPTAPRWYVSRVQTYKDGKWIEYVASSTRGPAIEYLIWAAKDTPYTASTLDIKSVPNAQPKGKIHFDGVRIQAFLNWITRAPTPTLTPTLTPSPTPAQLPDLTIVSAKVEKWDKAAKSVKATFTIKNNGTASTRALYNFTERSGGSAIELPASTCKVDQSTILAAGKSCDVIHVFTYDTTGTKVLTLTVDPQNEIQEIFESNNVRSANFTVTQ